MKENRILAIGIFMLFFLTGCGFQQETTESMQKYTAGSSAQTEISSESAETESKEEKHQILVTDGTHEVVFCLNDSSASVSLYEQLPLEIEVQNYSNNEKIFYPAEELDISDVTEGGGTAGGLAYFSPWGNIVMYYGDFNQYSGLYLLGEAISGTEQIALLSGTITIQQEVKTAEYTVQDIQNLQNFLLCRPASENLIGKKYDLNSDNRWDVFDLCLMKKAVLQKNCAN